MPDVPDVTRSAHLADRATKLRAAVESLMEQLVDQGMRDLLRRSVLYQVEDVQRMLSLTGWAGWLSAAEILLWTAEEQFARLSRLIDTYGGPKKVVTIG